MLIDNIDLQIRSKLQSEVRNLSADLDSMRDQFEEEQESKADLQRQLSKAHTEVSTLRAKFESEGGARSEEIEESRYEMAVIKFTYNFYSLTIYTHFALKSWRLYFFSASRWK